MAEVWGISRANYWRKATKAQQIAGWLKYWRAAQMVATEEIQTAEDMVEARRWCACMRSGVFIPELVSTAELWGALSTLRTEGHPI